MLCESGAKTAEEFRQGERLAARNEFDPNGPIEWKEIEEVFVRQGIVLEVTIGGKVIGTTAEHPFYLYGQGWTPAGELQVGDLLATADGRWLPVEKLYNTGKLETVYNFRIADHHTYFVGDNDWGFFVWSHNQYTNSQNAGRYSRQEVVDENGMSVRRLSSRGGAANPEKGNSARDALAGRISKNKNVASIRTEVTIPTAPGAGGRRYDIEVTLHDGRTIYIEVKSGIGRVDMLQAAKDAYLKNKGFTITTVRVP